jgi:glycosyltransferase involved in cell wall biosynthesis
MNQAAKLNVLMVDSEVSWRGGEGQLELLMKGLLGSNFRVALAAPSNAAITRRAKSLGVPCLPLPIAGDLDLVAAWRLRGYLRRNRFDIVHCHSSHAHGVAFIARGGSLSPRPTRTRPALVVSRRVDFPVGRNGLGALKYRRGADVYVAVSNGVRDVLIRSGVPDERVRLVQDGINLKKFAGVKDHGYLLDEFGLSPDTPVIGNVAALAPHKSQVDFIRAAAIVTREIPGAKFFIVGEGRLRRRLEALIKDLGLQDTVFLPGFRSDVLEFLSLFHCFVMSSYLEGLCTSIMDAQAMGIPVVATNTGGIPDLVEDQVTGLLAPPRDPARIAGAVIRMMRDANLSSGCVERARTKAQSYDYRHMVDGTVDVYRQTLEGKRK